MCLTRDMPLYKEMTVIVKTLKKFQCFPENLLLSLEKSLIEATEEMGHNDDNM